VGFLADTHVRQIGLVDLRFDPNLVERRDSIEAHPRIDRCPFHDVFLDYEAARR
jgi:hypothetical protein